MASIDIGRHRLSCGLYCTIRATSNSCAWGSVDGDKEAHRWDRFTGKCETGDKDLDIVKNEEKQKNWPENI